MEAKDQTPFIAWITMNNIVPVIVSFISIGISVGAFWYNIKLEIKDVKNETQLTNQKLDQVIASLRGHMDVSDKALADLGKLANRITVLETINNVKGK